VGFETVNGHAAWLIEFREREKPMSEWYTTRGGTRIGGEAVYSNYRQFQTGGRVITP
jgi:hypothetical protein